MRHSIATLRERMEQGGDWRAFRDEIAALHAQDNSEEEYVELLHGHHLLRLLIDDVYDAETAKKLHQIAESEYRFFLNKEAMRGERINPDLLEYVTRREVEAGRLDEDSDLRKLAVAGAAVLGDPSKNESDPGQSAVWGGATLGLLVGLAMLFFWTGSTWGTLGKAVLIGAFAGWIAELLPRLFSCARS
ncbi:MAG: hypothetical protein JSS55_09195 [Proteobacteria bacterium]|nr:hypothetical protein [Pseudomonadota bacterium]